MSPALYCNPQDTIVVLHLHRCVEFLLQFLDARLARLPLAVQVPLHAFQLFFPIQERPLQSCLWLNLLHSLA